MDLHPMDKKKMNNKFRHPKERRHDGQQQPRRLEEEVEESVDPHPMESHFEKKNKTKKNFHRPRGREQDEELQQDEDDDDSDEELHPGAFREGGLNRELEDEFTTTTYPTTSTIQPSPALVASSLEIISDNEALAAEVVPGKEEIIQQRLQERTVDALKVVPDSTVTSPSSNQKKTSIIVIFMFGMLLLGVALAVILPSQDNINDNIFPPPIDSAVDGPTMSPTVSTLQSALELLTPISGKETLLNESTPQYQAIMWLVHEDNNVLTQQNPILLEEDDDNSRMLLIERYIMALLYFATGGPNFWFVECNFLNITTSVCEWNVETIGVLGCNELGQVTQIRIDRNNLNGTLPSELSTLTSLELLSIAISNLHGTLPPSLGDISNLNYLQIAYSQISGSIPESFSKLRKLQLFWLSFNALTGSIPSDLFVKLPSLERLALFGNYLSGTIPEFLETHEIRQLYLHDNMFTGWTPDSLYASSLDTLWLNGNQLSGTISTRVGRLVDMQTFLASHNGLTGTLPTEIGMFSNLQYLYLDDNKLSGTIPTEVGLLTRLDELTLAENNLSGTVPQDMADLSAISIFLQSNNLAGPLDMFCAQEALLTRVDADCGGENPLVDCPCCVSCCGKDMLGDEECTLNYESSCRIDLLSYEDERGAYYEEAAGTVCNCSNDVTSNITLSCSDADCQMCNLDGTVCAVNQMYYFGFDKDGITDYYNATFQYMVGRNDTVTFESLSWSTEFECHVAVNGEMCNSCGAVACRDGFIGFVVECDNVEGAGSVNICNERQDDDEGPLAVFAFQEPMRRTGCPPRMFPIFV